MGYEIRRNITWLITWKRLGMATASRFGNRRYGRFGNLRYDKCSETVGLVPPQPVRIHQPERIAGRDDAIIRGQRLKLAANDLHLGVRTETPASDVAEFPAFIDNY